MEKLNQSKITTNTPKITPYLWFNGNVAEAVNFYTTIFDNSEIVNLSYMGEKVFMATFELEGQKFMALDGGPKYPFTPAISLFVTCETQEEVDNYWYKLIADGGSESKCGWLKDKFGLSWQIIPTALGRLMGDPDRVKAQRVMQAMLGMEKIDIKGLEDAYNQV